jgi:hypothetical protein
VAIYHRDSQVAIRLIITTGWSRSIILFDLPEFTNWLTFECRNGRTLIVWVTLNSMIGALFGILFFNQVGLYSALDIQVAACTWHKHHCRRQL